MLSGKKSNFNFQNGVFLEKKIEIPKGSRHFLTCEAECPGRVRNGGGEGVTEGARKRGSKGDGERQRERERGREGEGEGEGDGEDKDEGEGEGEGAGESAG